MGVRNYLIDGVSGTGKTTVCTELARRGFHTIHGDRELAYQGDPHTGDPTPGVRHENHIWNIDRVQAEVRRDDHPVSFFCGGARNVTHFVDLFDGVFVLYVDLDTLVRRLRTRPPTEWGAAPAELDLIVEMHRTGAGLPTADSLVDATRPIAHVVDSILHAAGVDPVA